MSLLCRCLFNRALNYGYGILRTRVWAAAVLGGLDPAAGFLHAWQPNRDSLVLDLMEGFRQIAVDRPLAAAALRRWRPRADAQGDHLDEDSRKFVAARVLEQLARPVRCGRRQRTLLEWIDAEVRACRRTLLGENAGPAPVQTW